MAPVSRVRSDALRPLEPTPYGGQRRRGLSRQDKIILWTCVLCLLYLAAQGVRAWVT